MQNEQDLFYMQRALELAQYAAQQNEVPIGAVIVQDNKIIAEGWNCPIATCDPSAHAEIQALRNAGQKLQNYRLPEATLYVTLEPCVMCVGAMIHARIKRLVYGAKDPKAGAIESVFQIMATQQLNHHFAITSGILADPCGKILSEFFQSRR
jgi:tRNA(adenine34) deaminase